MLLCLLIIQNTMPITQSLMSLWNTVALQKTWVVPSRNKHQVFYRIQRFITVFTKGHQGQLQFNPVHMLRSHSSKIYFNCNIHFYQDFWQKSCMNFILLDFVTVIIQYLVITVILIFDKPPSLLQMHVIISMWCKVQIIKLHITKFSLSLCIQYYSLKYPLLLKRAQPTRFPCGARYLTHNKLQLKLHVSTF
jgi:hypothetical protein